jgi:sterol 3beta-glucosyltransferase
LKTEYYGSKNNFHLKVNYCKIVLKLLYDFSQNLKKCGCVVILVQYINNQEWCLCQMKGVKIEMKIVICTMGSRGDVEPYLSLGIELAQLGHEIYISAPVVYKELVEETKLNYLAMNSVSPQDMMKIPDVQRAFESGKMVKALVLLMKKSKLVIKDFLKEMYKNTQGMDAVITTMILYGAFDGTEKQNIPCIYTLLNPAIPTKEFPTVISPNIPRFLYKFSHRCLERAFWLCFKKQCNWLRKNEWYLPKLNSCPINQIKKNRVPILLGYSKAIVPVPKDWDENVIVTGYWQRKSKKDLPRVQNW